MEQHCSDEHEEGEIIDDFEDISDYSIPSTSYSGKSVSHRDLLQDVSLSSISDNEPDALIYLNTFSSSRSKRTKRRRNTIHCHRRKRHKCGDYYRKHRLSRYVSPTSYSSGSSDVEIDPKTQKQLQDAIRIERSHIHHNSLRTRLRAMLQNDNVQNKTEDEEENTLRTLALLSNSKDDIEVESKQVDKLNDVGSMDDKDDELIELRLAALKSAVLKKVPEIRKRKCRQQPMLCINKVNEINKENNVNQENNVKEDSETIKGTELPDTKLVTDPIEANADISKSISIEEDVDIMRAKLLASMSKKIASNLPKQAMVNSHPEKKIFAKQQSKIKPLIINLNDSDSDTDITTKEGQQSKDNGDISLVNSVNEFLRKQRAAVEARNKSQKITQTALDKSVVKLLPKSQQREYHFLKQKLLLAKKKRLRKSTVKNNNEVTVKGIPKETAFTEVTTLEQQSAPKTGGLQKALEDLQIKKNGRLQMKGKYKALAPLLQKVSQASIERKRCETEIKMLLDSLQKARDKLALSHQNYSNLVMRLTNQKNTIDRRINKMKFINNNVRTINNTSTPMKCNVQETTCDISSIHNTTNDNTKESKPNSNDEQNGGTDHMLPEINNADGLAQCSSEGNVLKQYVSPLDNKNRFVSSSTHSFGATKWFFRDIVEDPLTTFCPYELFGVCKDAECKYNHCSKT